MMHRQQQYCSVEQGKRLMELGITADSTGCYIGDPNPDPKYHEPYDFFYSDDAYSQVGKSWWDMRLKVWSVAELGIMLPDMPADHTGSLHVDKQFRNNYTHGGKWAFQRHGNYTQFGLYDTEAEARAAMLIYLLENKLITADEANENLNKSTL